MRRYFAMPDVTELAQEAVLVEHFPDGETANTVPDFSEADDVVLVGHCASALASETFLAAAYEMAHNGPRSLTVVNTYFRHARCDRKFVKNSRAQAVMAKFQARQWSGVGTIFPGVRLVFLDLHNDLVLSYFEGPVRTTNLSALPLLERKMQGLWGGLHDPVYATVDYGGLHEARLLAEKRGVGLAHIDKVRISATETEIRGVHGDDVDGRDVVIFDDMISTGGSTVKAAHAYKDRGARRVFVVTAHGLFVNNGVAKLMASPIEGVLVTDSHPNAVAAHAQASSFVSVYQLRPEQLAPAA